MDASVSVSDVQAALNTTANNLATLCAHSSINKWSRFKPIRDPRINIKLDAKASNTSSWYNYQAPSIDMNAGVAGEVPNPQGCCGLNIVAHQLSDLLDSAKLAWDWAYLPPTGKALLDGKVSTDKNKWTAQRLGDFRGYKHNAQCPFYELIAGNIMPVGGEIKLRTQYGLTQFGSSYNGAIGIVGVPTTPGPGALSTSEIMFPNTTVPLSECKKILIFFPKDANGNIGTLTGYAAATARDHRTTDGVYDVFPFSGNQFSTWSNGAVVFVCYTNKNQVLCTDKWQQDTLLVLHPTTPRFDVKFGSTADAREITIRISARQIIAMAIDETTGTTAIRWTLDITVGDNGGMYPNKSFTFKGKCVIKLLGANKNVLWWSDSLVKSDLTVNESYTQSGTLSTSTPGITKQMIEDARIVRVELFNNNYSDDGYILRTISSDINHGAFIGADLSIPLNP